MDIMRIFLLCLALLTAPHLIAHPALADAAGARGFIEKTQGDVEKLLAQPKSDSRERALTALLDGFLDYDAIAERSLGDEWAARSPAEKAQFKGILRQLIERSYTGNLKRTLTFDVRHLGSSEESGLFVIKTEARNKKNRRAAPVSIDYRVAERAGAYHVVDVITDGVSLVDNYRRQFVRTLRREGWDALIAKMERRLEGGDETAD